MFIATCNFKAGKEFSFKKDQEIHGLDPKLAENLLKEGLIIPGKTVDVVKESSEASPVSKTGEASETVPSEESSEKKTRSKKMSARK